MKPILLYLSEVIVISGILYGYYHFFLRNKKFHDYNRYYLLLAIGISIIVPFLNIPVYFTQQQADPSTLLHTLTAISAGSFEEHGTGENPVINATNPFTFNNILVLLYVLAGTFLSVRFIAGLVKIIKLKRKFPVEKIDNIYFVNTNEPGTPFSFFRNLFWNEKIALGSEDGLQIFRHELFHIQQKHSLDIIFIEMAYVIFWMNPFFFLIKKEIKTIHEFLADSFAVHKNREWNYAELLLMQVLGSPNTRLTNTFFHNQIKRRITMITSSPKTSYQYLRKLLVLPVAVVITVLFAFKYKTKEGPGITHLPFAKTITVVVDAGHGGKTGSVAADGTYEDDISLAIAKKVKELNINSGIKIVLTRETSDAMDLKQRSESGNKQHPDLFISIHCAAAEKDESAVSGAEVFVSRKNTKWSIQNKTLGSILLNNFSTIYPVNNNEVQQREIGIWVLDNSNCPAALLECGYITNAKDLAFVKDPFNQEKIAKNILQSIEKYSTYKETPGTAKKTK
jgi:bla regulator protein blaR1